MIERPHYLQMLINNKNNGFPKVITGIRRCGKSYLMKEIYAQYLRKNGIEDEQILIIELDDDRNLQLRNPIELGKYNGYTVNVGAYEKVEKNREGKSVKKNYEIDFFAVKNQRMYYIQVASDISDPATKLREQKPYIALNDQIQKIIVINKPVNEMRDDKGFTVIGIADFLLRFIK